MAIIPDALQLPATDSWHGQFGIEAARIILGHPSTAITEVYAEKDEHEVIEAIAEVG